MILHQNNIMLVCKKQPNNTSDGGSIYFLLIGKHKLENTTVGLLHKVYNLYSLTSRTRKKNHICKLQIKNRAVN